MPHDVPLPESTLRLRTERLELVAATLAMARAELEDVTRLGPLLDAVVPPTWPPALYDRAAIEYTLRWMEANPECSGWGLWYFLHCDGDAAADGAGRVLVGVGGFKGAPSDEGEVEIGYSVLAEHQRRGIASEAVRGFLERAFADPTVHRVVAETLPELAASIRVLEKAGFTLVGEGSEPDVIRYALSRSDRRGGMPHGGTPR